MLSIVHTRSLDKPSLSEWHLDNVPRVLRTGRTKCCFTKHYQVNDGNAVCTNSKCANYLGETNILRRHRVKRIVTGALFFLFLAVFTFDDYSHTVTHDLVFKRPPAPLNAENLSTELRKAKVLCPDEVYAQMMLESGNLQSNLVKRTNNMLGMRFPFQRQTTASGLYVPSKDTIIKGDASTLRKYALVSNYAVYDNWQDAVRDYKMWQDAHFSLKERYLTFLGNVYAEDAAYAQKI